MFQNGAKILTQINSFNPYNLISHTLITTILQMRKLRLRIMCNWFCQILNLGHRF